MQINVEREMEISHAELVKTRNKKLGRLVVPSA
jgi:hypothetical protein